MTELAFWSSQLAQELTNFMGGPIQTAEGITGLGFGVAYYRKHKCGHCWRPGRHTVHVPRADGNTETHPSCKWHLDHDHAAKTRSTRHR